MSADLQVEQLAPSLFQLDLIDAGQVGGELDGDRLACTHRALEVIAVHVDLIVLVALDLDTDPLAALDGDPPLGRLDRAASHSGLDQGPAKPAVVVVASLVEVGPAVEVGLPEDPLVLAAWPPPSSPPQPATSRQASNRPAAPRRRHAIDFLLVDRATAWPQRLRRLGARDGQRSWAERVQCCAGQPVAGVGGGCRPGPDDSSGTGAVWAIRRGRLGRVSSSPSAPATSGRWATSPLIWLRPVSTSAPDPSSVSAAAVTATHSRPPACGRGRQAASVNPTAKAASNAASSRPAWALIRADSGGIPTNRDAASVSPVTAAAHNSARPAAIRRPRRPAAPSNQAAR